MTELNGCEPMEIKVTGPYTFTIKDTTGMGEYKSGGYAKQVKMSKTVSFLKMRESKVKPEFTISDFAKMDRQEQLVIGFEAVDAFAKANGGAMPLPANKEHAAQVLALAKDINSKAGNLVSELDEKLLTLLASNARGDLSPMAAVLGGVVGQEVLKAVWDMAKKKATLNRELQESARAAEDKRTRFVAYTREMREAVRERAAEMDAEGIAHAPVPTAPRGFSQPSSVEMDTVGSSSAAAQPVPAPAAAAASKGAAARGGDETIKPSTMSPRNRKTVAVSLLSSAHGRDAQPALVIGRQGLTTIP